jgi:hypothetical protein
LNRTLLPVALALAGLALTLGARSHAQQAPAVVLAPTNRYNNTPYLRPFPDSALPGAYEMSFRTEFHFGIPYASAAVRYAAYRTLRRLGKAAVPMEICDCSTAAGSTPEGRHPGAAHDGGVNFDITYFMKREVEDRIVCPQNADNHCTGPATDLDAERQAYFFATLGQLDEELRPHFIGLMAVDAKVKEAVDPALDRLAAAGLFTPTVIAHTKELVFAETTDQQGWYRFHHNHTHLRFLWQQTTSTTLDGIIGGKIARLMAAAPGAPEMPAAPATPHPAPPVNIPQPGSVWR